MRFPFGRKTSADDAPATSPAHEQLEAARQQLRDGDATEALRLLTFGFTTDAAYRELYVCAREVLTQLQAPDEAALFAAALKNFDDALPFFNLGYHFIDVGHDRLAIPFLERASQLQPHNPTIDNELAIALCGQFQPQRALEIVEALPEPRPFWVQFQRCWAAILCNRRDGLSDWLQGAHKYLQETNDIADDEKSSVAYALRKLDECVERLESVPAPRPRIDDWQFIQYGAVVLDLMDDRIVEDGMEVAGGRHVASWACVEDIKRMLEKLRDLLRDCELMPQKIIAVPDRDSQIIATAAAQIFGVPLQVAHDDDEIAQPHSLVIASAADGLELSALATVLDGQTVFALSLHWLHPSQVTPDVCGVMAQTYGLPWQGGAMQFDAETQELKQSEADARSIELIAQEIVDAEAEIDAHWAEQKNWFVERRALLKAGRAAAPRLPFRTDSPIPGSYFC